MSAIDTRYALSTRACSWYVSVSRLYWLKLKNINFEISENHVLCVGFSSDAAYVIYGINSVGLVCYWNNQHRIFDYVSKTFLAWGYAWK